MCQARRFAGDPFEDVVHERVHDAHGLAGDASVGMHLLQHLVDVDAEAFLSAGLPFLFAVLRRLLFNQLLTTFGSNHCACLLACLLAYVRECASDRRLDI